MTEKNLADRMNTPEANRKKGPGRYDWDTIRQDYITSNLSYKDIAEKYGPLYRTVSTRASKEKWTEARAKYRKQVEKETIQKTARRTASKKCDVLDSVFASAARSAEIVADKLENEEELTSQMLKQYIESLKLIEDITRNVKGILTKKEERKLKIEEERLELEKRKVEAGEPDRDINITIRGYKDEWGE